MPQKKKKRRDLNLGLTLNQLGHNRNPNLLTIKECSTLPIQSKKLTRWTVYLCSLLGIFGNSGRNLSCQGRADSIDCRLSFGNFSVQCSSFYYRKCFCEDLMLDKFWVAEMWIIDPHKTHFSEMVLNSACFKCLFQLRKCLESRYLVFQSFCHDLRNSQCLFVRLSLWRHVV